MVEPIRCWLSTLGATMKRREFIGLVGGAATWPVVALAQQPEPMRRIGVLVGLTENDPEMKERLAGFRQGLEKLGWSEGSNVRIDYRFAARRHSGALACKRTCRVAARCDPRTVNTRDRCLETRDQYDPYRFRWRRRPNWIGFRCKLVATQRQSHRLIAIRRGYHRQMAGYAQGDCTEPHARCSFGQSKNDAFRLLPAVCQNASSIARD